MLSDKLLLITIRLQSGTTVFLKNLSSTRALRFHQFFQVTNKNKAAVF